MGLRCARPCEGPRDEPDELASGLAGAVMVLRASRGRLVGCMEETQASCAGLVCWYLGGLHGVVTDAPPGAVSPWVALLLAPATSVSTVICPCRPGASRVRSPEDGGSAWEPGGA